MARQWIQKTMDLDELKNSPQASRRLRMSLTAEALPENPPGPLTVANAADSSAVFNDSGDGVITRTYRSLTAADMPARMVDYSNPIALAAMQRDLGIFNRQHTGHKIGVFKDHKRSVEAWIGWVDQAYWSEGNENLPPGINQVISYDEIATGPAIAQGVRRNALSAVSVSIEFEWEQSHKDLDEDQFFVNLIMGKKGPDGKPVRVVPNKFINNLETSLVWQGADSFAKGLEPAETSATSQSSSAGDSGVTSGYAQTNSDPFLGINATTGFNINWGTLQWTDEHGNVFEVQGTGPIQPQEDTGMNPEVQEAILQVLRLFDPILENLDGFTKEQAGLIQSKVSRVDQELTAAKQDLVEQSKVADAYRNSLKDRLSKAAALVLDGTSAATIIEMSNRSSTIVELETLTNIYERRAEELFPLTCPKCKVQLSRQSSVTEDPPKADETQPQGLIEHEDDQLSNKLK